MKILKTKQKKTSSEGRFMGAYLSPQIDSYLSLYSIAKGLTKSMILRGLMQQWYSKERKANSEYQLIQKIIGTAQHEFEIRKKQPGGCSLDSFKQELAIELTNKRIDNDHIATIIMLLGP